MELVARMGMQQFNIEYYRSLVEWLEATALQTTRGMVLAGALVDELRRCLIVLPSLAVIERIAAEAGTRAQRRLISLLTKDLTAEHHDKACNLAKNNVPMDYFVEWLMIVRGRGSP